MGNRSRRGKTVSIINFECVFVGLLIQNEKRMRRIIFSFGLSGSTTFSTLSHKLHDFREKMFIPKRVFPFFSKTSA